jgi:hypothetical protein
VAAIAARALRFFFQATKALCNPMVIPRGRHRLLVEAEWTAQEVQHSQIVERVHLARHRHRHRTHACTRGGVGGKQRRLRILFLEVFDDGERLRDDLPAIIQGGNQTLRIQPEEFRRAMLGIAQMLGDGLVGQRLEVERDAHAERRGAAIIGVQLH